MKIGIYGFGAVGSAIYGELEEYKDLYVLMDQERIVRYQKEDYYINGRRVYPKYISSGVMDVIFVCLKNYSLMEGIQGLKPFLGRKTMLIPMMNGILAHDILKNAYPNLRVLYSVINVEANKEGNQVICGKILNLQFGDAYNYPTKKDVLQVRKLLLKYHVNNHIYPDMQRRVWLKWMLNMGINTVSALCNATYKDMSHPLLQELFQDIFYEVYLVGLAYGIHLFLSDIEDQMYYCRRFNSNRVTSLTLDFQKNKENELDSFLGVFLRMAREKKIDTPVTKTMYRLLKSFEDNRRE